MDCFFKCSELKDCSRFTPWLYHILARNAYRIGKRSRRETPVGDFFERYAGGQHGSLSGTHSSGKYLITGNDQSAGRYVSQGDRQSGGNLGCLEETLSESKSSEYYAGSCGSVSSGKYVNTCDGECGWLESAGGIQSLETVIEDENRKEIWEAVMQLNLKLRTVVVLYYYNDLSTKEIAQITHSLEGTVKSRLYTARKILGQKLRKF